MTYEYRHVVLVRAVDGDTVELDINQGNHTRWIDHFRLAGIDTPERGKPGAAEATARLREILDSGIARVQTNKPDKYGRWLADIWVAVDGGEMHVNTMMINEGFATPYSGGARSPA